MPLRLSALALTVLLVGTACSADAPKVTEEGKQQALGGLTDLSASAGITLTENEASCAFDRLGQEEADMLASGGALDDVMLPTAAEGIIACVGSELIAEALLATQAPAATADELTCAAKKIDDELVIRLVLSTLEQSPVSRPAVELAVASSLAQCLSPENLLNQG
ncbi:MAG: hypothetical protein R2706_21030 [Acidimicrobiales bacterium]